MSDQTQDENKTATGEQAESSSANTTGDGNAVSSDDTTDAAQTDKTVDDSDASEREKRVEGLAKEEEKLLKSISDLRAERRTLSSPSSPDTSQSDSTDGDSTKTDSGVLEIASEKRALRALVEKYPQYADDQEYQRLRNIYRPRRGSILWEDILDDLDDAHFLLNRDSMIQSEASKASRETAKQMHEANRADIGSTSTSVTEDTTQKVELTKMERDIFEKMQKVDPKLTEEKYINRKKQIEG